MAVFFEGRSPRSAAGRQSAGGAKGSASGGSAWRSGDLAQPDSLDAIGEPGDTGIVPLVPGAGRFISTSSVVLAVNLHLPHLPERGSAIRAQTALSTPGGSYTTLACVRAHGVETCLAAPLGTGPNSFSVRRQLRQEGIRTLTEVLVGDIGVALVMVEQDGSTTTVLSAGVESEPTLASLQAIELQSGDLVHISGSDLSMPSAARVLTQWGAALPDYVKLVVSISPAVEEVPAQIWPALLGRADLVTMNIREASILSEVLNSNAPGIALRHVLREDAAVVRRLGVRGCEVQTHLGADTVPIAPFRARKVDTTGVGDTHVATMCARLLLGDDLVTACRKANAAAALMLSRESNVDAPSVGEIEEVMDRGYVG